MIDQNIVIHYPAALYFFVNKNNKKLYEQLLMGLEKMIANGKFDKMFYQHHDTFIKEARLNKRTIIELKNPILPPKTPLDRKNLWFSIE